jgi:SAM-dependent methyltransferase
MSQPHLFDEYAEVYDQTIDWPKRLANEKPFYCELFKELNVKRVLDVACGTGRHAEMFCRMGLEVEASDLSPAMIELGRKRVGDSPWLTWTQRSFTEPAGEGRFDMAICVGNSLALVDDLALVGKALEAMIRAVRPGGAVVVQVPNLWRLADGPCLWQRCTRIELQGRPVLAIKGIHRCGDMGLVEVLMVDEREGKLIQSRSTPFLGLDRAWLEERVRAAGAGTVAFYGGYGKQPYADKTSEDLLMAALSSE